MGAKRSIGRIERVPLSVRYLHLRVAFSSVLGHHGLDVVQPCHYLLLLPSRRSCPKHWARSSTCTKTSSASSSMHEYPGQSSMTKSRSAWEGTIFPCVSVNTILVL